MKVSANGYYEAQSRLFESISGLNRYMSDELLPRLRCAQLPVSEDAYMDFDKALDYCLRSIKIIKKGNERWFSYYPFLINKQAEIEKCTQLNQIMNELLIEVNREMERLNIGD